MWVEKHGQQHRVYYRTRNEGGPKKAFEPFSTRDQAEAFIKLARASSLPGAVAYVRDPHPDALMALLGRSPVQVPVARCSSSRTQSVRPAPFGHAGALPPAAGLPRRHRRPGSARQPGCWRATSTSTPNDPSWRSGWC